MVDVFAKENGNLPTMYCSAKTGEGVEELFLQLVNGIFQNKAIMSRLRTAAPAFAMEEVQPEPAQKDCC